MREAKREKTWTDQPDLVLDGDVACHGTSSNGAWEVRRIGGKFTVTVGDLFQSQTVWCPDVDVMLVVLNRALNGRRNQPLPEGAELLQAPKKRS